MSRHWTSNNKLLTTVGYRLDGKTTYALEGSIFVAGAAVQWLRDGIGIIDTAHQTEAMAESLDSNNGVYLVPAFTGLGAPHWDPDARGAIFGITRDTGPAELVRATLESVCYQTFDLLEAKRRDGIVPTRLRVDGGMVQNNWLCKFLADLLDIIVERPVVTETTALGAAYLAGTADRPVRLRSTISQSAGRRSANLTQQWIPTNATCCSPTGTRPSSRLKPTPECNNR